MKVSVYSEIGRLAQVLVHTPGQEIVRMTQHELDRLLFDDILSPAEAVREHEIMIQVLEGTGAQVLQIAELLRHALERAPAEEKERLLFQVSELAGAPELPELIGGWSPAQLTEGLISGIYQAQLEQLDGRPPLMGPSLASLRARVLGSDGMALWPVPNLMFMRDPCISVFDGVVMGRMATQARAREALLVTFALRFGEDGPHPTKLLFASPDQHRNQVFRKLEGGDVLVVSPHLLLIGCSLRTSAQTIERLAAEALFPGHDQLERIYAIMIPEERSTMHLDTVLSQIDKELFLGHQPMVDPQDGKAPAPVVRLTRDRAPELIRGASTLDVLREELGQGVEVIPCGGDDPLYQQREQWTDGANAVCLAPGRILLYGRNVRTIGALKKCGFEEVQLSVVQPKIERKAAIETAMKKERVVFSFSGSELSRARGGGRCLTMPLKRDMA